MAEDPKDPSRAKKATSITPPAPNPGSQPPARPARGRSTGRSVPAFTGTRQFRAVEHAIRRSFARNVHRLRGRRQLTQQSLAERAGLVTRHIQKIEAGEVNATLNTIGRVAFGLEVEVPELFVTDDVASSRAPAALAARRRHPAPKPRRRRR
jgi:DNA-binding XRE family transcriptional regulator